MGAIESTSFNDRDDYDTDRDEAKDPGRMTLPKLERFLEDLRWEAPWRVEADRCCDYYDNNQLNDETLEGLERRGLGPIIRNIIKPTVDTILGLEERAKSDWKVTTDYEDQTDVADAISVKLAEAEKASQADRAISEAYAGMVKSGFAAVEVSRSANPFEFPYRVRSVHRRELFWDPRSRANDWHDARFIVRRRWYDVDVACAYFPKQAEIIKHAIERWNSWESALEMLSDHNAQSMLAQSLAIERATNIDEMSWRDCERQQVCLFEVWYRVWYRGFVLKLPRGRVVEYDPKNRNHAALVQANVAKPEEAVYDKLRCAYFAGPHRLADFATGRRRFPYVPFWAYREDLTGVPYGQIRSMVSTQDEINARAANMYWLLKARRMLIDSDALDQSENTLSDAELEFGRADGVIVLNPNRRNQNAVQIMENLQLAEAQRMAMLEAIQGMSQVSGIYQTMMGQNTSTTAAAAIDKLLDAGTTSLAEMNGNYAWARREVGDRLCEMVKEDMTQAMSVSVDTGTSTRTVQVNLRVMDPDTGEPVVHNSIQNAVVKVTLSDIPSNPSYRDGQFAHLSEFVKSMPPEIQAVLSPFVIEGSNQPKRKEMAKLLREKFGIIDERSPEGQKMKAEQDKMAKAQADQLAKQFDTELAEIQARTNKFNAEAEKIRLEAGLGDDGKAAEINQLKLQNAADLMKLRDEYEKKILKLMADKLKVEADRQLDKAKIEMEGDLRVNSEQEETERQKLRISSSERIAATDKVAEEKLAKITEDMKKLSDGIDVKFEKLKQGFENAKVKDDAKRTVETTKLQATVEKKIGGIEKKVAAAKAKPKPTTGKR